MVTTKPRIKGSIQAGSAKELQQRALNALKPRSQSYKGIPAEDRPAVERMIAAMRLTGGEVPSPQAAYQRLKAGWKQQREEQAEQARLNAIKRSRQLKDTARQTVSEAIGKLAVVRDFLGGIAEGSDYGGMQPEQLAPFACAFLSEAGAELEEALNVLGLASPLHDAGPEGWFSNNLK